MIPRSFALSVSWIYAAPTLIVLIFSLSLFFSSMNSVLHEIATSQFDAINSRMSVASSTTFSNTVFMSGLLWLELVSSV